MAKLAAPKPAPTSTPKAGTITQSPTDVAGSTPAQSAALDLPDDILHPAMTDEQFDYDLENRKVPIDTAALATPLDKIGHAEHSAAYMAARRVVHGTVEKCDTTVGGVLQWAPPVKAVCTTANVLDNLDNAYDNHLIGRPEGVKDSLVQAARSAVPGLDTATTVYDMAKAKYPSIGGADAPSGPEIASVAQAAGRGPSAGFMSFLSGKDSPEPNRSSSLKIR